MAKVHLIGGNTVQLDQSNRLTHVFWCPGCECYHAVAVGVTEHPKWSFNGDFDHPTFYPSILVLTGHYAEPNSCWCEYNREHPDTPGPTCCRCHSFVTNGMIQFLPDSTHKLAGKTVELPNIDW
jgi:hypothetical protein